MLNHNLPKISYFRLCAMPCLLKGLTPLCKLAIYLKWEISYFYFISLFVLNLLLHSKCESYLETPLTAWAVQARGTPKHMSLDV